MNDEPELYYEIHRRSKEEREEKDRLIKAFQNLTTTQAYLIKTLEEKINDRS